MHSLRSRERNFQWLFHKSRIAVGLQQPFTSVGDLPITAVMMNLRGEGPLVTPVLKRKPLFLWKVQSLPQKPNAFCQKCHLRPWTRASEQREFWTHTPSAGVRWDFGFEKGPWVVPAPLEPNLDDLLPLAWGSPVFPAPGLPAVWAPRRVAHPPGLCVGASGTCFALVSPAPVYLGWAGAHLSRLPTWVRAQLSGSPPFV